MNNQRPNFIFYQLLVSFFFFPAVSFAANLSSLSRDQLIQGKLNCVNATEKSRWVELCALSDQSSGRSREEKREDIISRALDSVAREMVAEVKTAEEKPSEEAAEAAPEPGPSWTEREGREDAGAIELKEREIEFGSELFWYSYKEPIFNLETDGWQYGVMGAYIYRPPEGEALRSEVLNMYKIDARFASGPVDYSSNPSGTLEDEDNYAFEVRGAAGYDHLFNEQFLLTGYAGLGFRYLNNDSGGRQTTTGAYGYERVSNYIYLPVGVEALNQIAPHWKIASNFEWDIFLWGEQTSYLSDVNSGYPDLENDQGRGYGLRGSVRLVNEGENINFFLEPFFRYWRIHDSEVTTAVGSDYIVTGLEPDNNTTEYGVKLGFQY